MKNSRHVYNNLLAQPLHIPDLLRACADLLDADPYFAPAYLEFLWNAEEHHDEGMYHTILKRANSAILTILKDRTLQNTLSEEWIELELRTAREILSRSIKHQRFSILRRLQSSIASQLLDVLIKSKTIVSPIENRHVRKITTVDPEPLQAELQAVSPVWWTVDTQRKNNVTHHQKTWSIALRVLGKDKTRKYQPIDDVHESMLAPESKLFPHTHALVMSLAKEMNLALGRVVVVMMEPDAQAYRHFDSEEWLRGRDRYHIVVSCGKNNILESGPERMNVQPGEVWQFDNKAMHRAINDSSIPRVHVIFDGLSLDKVREHQQQAHERINPVA